MKLTLDAESPVPLYHQIAEGIRYLLATGRLSPGDNLPTVRDAAAAWSVNLHTVRRAYADLAAAGLVEVRRARGVRVTNNSPSRAAPAARSPAQRFIAEVVQRARRDFGLHTSQLIDLIAHADGGRTAALRVPRISVVECSLAQAQDYARQIESRWSVVAAPWSLDQSEPPPPGPLVSTYFHYNDVRARWPARVHEMSFVSVRVNTALRDTLQAPQRGQTPRTVTLCEVDAVRAKSILGDLLVLLPADRFRVVTKLVRHPGDVFAGKQVRSPVLFAPRLWSQLTEQQQAHRQAFQLQYEIEPEALSSLGQTLGLADRVATNQRINPRRARTAIRLA